jgi:hypothetical protein
LPIADLILCLLLLQGESASPVLKEPDYFIDRSESNKWRLRKPRLQGSQEAWIIFEDKSRTIVENRRNALPRVRLSRPLVVFSPLTRQTMPLEDWTGENDALEIEADIQHLVNRFAPATARTLLSSTPVYMARLAGASGYTAEQANDARKFVVYIDPFRASGRLHAASTLVHELSHVERYRTRGFHANRAAAVLAKSDFILLGATDELAGYEAEAALIRALLSTVPSDAARRAIMEAMRAVELRWPAALLAVLDFEGRPGAAERMKQAREQIVLDIERQAAGYWDVHRDDTLVAPLEAAIRAWSRSEEWKDITAERSKWLEAGARVR